MSKKFLPLIFILITWNKVCYGLNNNPYQNNGFSKATTYTDTLVPLLLSLDLSYYSGKPVDSFLVKLPANYTDMQIGRGDQMKKAHFLYIKYANGVNIGVYVNQFSFMNPNPPASNWSIALFRKERIGRIEIYNGVICINGCQ